MDLTVRRVGRGARRGALSAGHAGFGFGPVGWKTAAMDDQELLAAAMDIERHVSANGWDQPALLFALVPTETIRADQPELAEQLGVTEEGPALTTFEQPAPPDNEELDEFLARIQWPPQVAGAALVVERIVLPPEAEAEIADRPDVAAAARAHPAAQDMRIVVAVMQDGEQMSVLRLRGAEDGPDAADDEVLTGADLVPGLSEALVATFR